MLNTRMVLVDLRIARLYLSMERKPELGVSGTNRPRSRQVMLNYARTMLRDEWRLIHQGIAFKGSLSDGTAELADGGHRIEAVEYAATVGFPDDNPPLPPRPDIEVPFMVTDGLTDADMLAMDIGYKRNPGHFLAMEGEASSTLLGAIIKLTWVYMQGLIGSYDGRRKTPMSPQQQQEHLAAYPHLRDAVRQGQRLHRIFTPTAAAAFWFLARETGYDEKDIDEFLDGLMHGEHMGHGDARFMLRELMLRSRKVHRVWETHEQLALMIKAFRRWLDGEEVKQMSFRTDEIFPTL